MPAALGASSNNIWTLGPDRVHPRKRLRGAVTLLFRARRPRAFRSGNYAAASSAAARSAITGSSTTAFVAGIEADIQGVAGQQQQRDLGYCARRFPSLRPPTNPYVRRSRPRSARLYRHGSRPPRLALHPDPACLRHRRSRLWRRRRSTDIAQFQCCAQFPGLHHLRRFSAGRLLRHARRLDGRWRPRVDVHAELVAPRSNICITISALSATRGPLGDLRQHVPVPSALVAGVAQSQTRFNGNIVRAGVNYHFNWGAAPIVAKY